MRRVDQLSIPQPVLPLFILILIYEYEVRRDKWNS